MNIVIYSFFKRALALPCLALSAALVLSACSDDTQNGLVPVDPPPTGDFELRSLSNDLTLIEGDEAGVSIPLAISRQNGHSTPVSLSLSGVSTEDTAFITSSFTRLTLTPNADESQALLTLSIADLPIRQQQRDFRITATDGTDTDEMLVRINVEPVDAPDVYLLVGQSNMVGFSGDGTRQAFPGGADEPHPRIKQLNVSKNDRETLFLTASDFTSSALNIVEPSIVTAEDPLHIPIDASNTSGKPLEYIGLGLSFAKRALADTTRDIILVPAAWSGSAFCTNENGPNGQWNAQPSPNSNLGNTWLFDRALTRANLALEETGGILRGILWHQGESDANDRCAPLYAENLERVVRQLRLRIDADRRGEELRRSDSNIPFIVGTMSRGVDERGDLSTFLPSKQIIDDAHRNLPNMVNWVGLSNHDDLIPSNGFPCGNTTCVHFGPGALREMGRRYYEALKRSAQ
ncbi:MAG: sialate O-acetylesterase [Granulosicoccus sp.]